MSGTVDQACSVDGCTRPVHGRGWCRSHYMRWWRYVNASEPPRPHRGGRGYVPIEDRLTNRWVVADNGCWLWTGTMQNAGYGEVIVNGNRRLAHRVIYELHHGPIASGLVVRHRCDTPACVNPDHLLSGTQADNIHDMHARGRARGTFTSLPREHGTNRGYRQHRRLGETLCDPCRQAAMAHRRATGLLEEQRSRRRAAS